VRERAKRPRKKYGSNGGGTEGAGSVEKAGKGVNKKGMSSDFAVQHRVD
jgi:hypothetical protein